MTIRSHRRPSDGMPVDTTPRAIRRLRDEPENEGPRREVTITEINEQSRAFHDAQPTVTRCALCDWTFEGTAAGGRLAAALHRQNAHGATASIEREEFGVDVQCKIEGCNNTAPSHGRYAKLCKEHRGSTAKPAATRRPRAVRSPQQPRLSPAASGSLAAAAQAVDTRLAEFQAAKAALGDAIENLRRLAALLEAA